MLDKLKSDFDGILELVNKCPVTLQDTALKVILEHWFSTNTVETSTTGGTKHGSNPPSNLPNVPDSVKPFMAANGITSEILGKAFHPVGPGAQLLATEIPGNAKSQKQANLSVLLAVRHALESGSFICTLKELREMAIHYNCYDSANFSTNLKTYKSYFKPRAKGSDVELSGPGLQKAAELIKGITTQ